MIILLSGDTGAVPIEEWNKTFGRADINSVSSVQQTLDGGYILAGQIMNRAGDSNVWLIKTDANGDEQWNRTFGRAHNGQLNRTFLGNNDWANSVQQISDGGYILSGGTASYGAGLSDVWLIKTDSNGSEQWNRTFGGTGRDEAYSVQQTSDSGYILTGRLDGAEDVNAWLIKTDTNGYEQWNRTFGGTGFDETLSVQQTTDGGYIIAGRTTSYGAGKSEDHFPGIYAAWLIKTDPNGKEQWNRTYGEQDNDRWVRRVQQTSDNGYMLAGGTLNKDGRGRALLIKTDLNGNEQWNRTFGGIDKGPSDVTDAYVQQTSDAGFILAASIFNNTKRYGKANAEALLIKIDAKGNKKWNKTFGGSNDTWVSSVQQTRDGGFITTGKIRSYDAQEHWIGDDAWLIKVSGESTKTAKAQTAVPAETKTVPHPEKAAGFEAVLVITILLSIYVARRERR